MVRVGHQKAGRPAAASSSVLRGTKVAKQQQRKKHKVVLESTSGDKNKQHNVLAFDAEPPAGYTFIPAGNPEFTAALKQRAKTRNLEILAVTTTPHASRHELSREVHRVGFHFPTVVVEEVCKYYGVELMSNGRLREDKDDDALFRRIYEGENAPRQKPKPDQVTINTEAKQIIKDLFPNIPDNDLFQIIKTAFQLGDGKVGTADEIPLVRRAQLSVVAHVRHTYTNYDKLLRQVPYSEARHRVENETLQKLVAWRGDNEDTKAMDDVLREVVVISDEEDSDDEVEEGQLYETDNLKVQPVKHNVRQENVTNGHPHSPFEIPSDEEPPHGYRYLPQIVRRIPARDQPTVAASRQQSRYARWDQMRQEHRAGAILPPASRILERTIVDDSFMPHTQPQYVVRETFRETNPGPRRIMEPPVRMVQQTQSTYVRGADGKLYERIVTFPEHTYAHPSPRRALTPPLSDVSRHIVQSRPTSPGIQQHPLHRRTESYEGDRNILPSIEGPNGAYLSPVPRRNLFDEPQRVRYTQQANMDHYDLYRPEIVDLTHSAEQVPKRRRVDVSPPPFPVMRQYQQDYHLREEAISNTLYNSQDDYRYPQRRIVDDDESTIDNSPHHLQHTAERAMRNEQIFREMPNIQISRDTEGGRFHPLTAGYDPRSLQFSHVNGSMDSPRRIDSQDEFIRQAGMTDRQPVAIDAYGPRFLHEERPTNVDVRNGYNSQTDRYAPQVSKGVQYIYSEGQGTQTLHDIAYQHATQLPHDGTRPREYPVSSISTYVRN